MQCLVRATRTSCCRLMLQSAYCQLNVTNNTYRVPRKAPIWSQTRLLFQSTTLLSQEKPASTNTTQWIRVYHLPSIRVVRLICRLKLYQTGATIAMIPYVMYLYNIGQVTVGNVQATMGIATFACFMLAVLSHYFQRCVGRIGFNPVSEEVEISTLNFWGKRHNAVLPLEDIVPFSELPDNPTDVYMVLRRYSSKQTAYLSLKHGYIIDSESFRKIFGSI